MISCWDLPLLNFVGFSYAFTSNSIIATNRLECKRPNSRDLYHRLCTDLRWRRACWTAPGVTHPLPPKLPFPDCFHFSAAEGWLALGDPDAANDELDQIRADVRIQAEVLVLRWYVYAKARKWEYALIVAETMALSYPTDPRGWIYMCKTLKFLKQQIQQAYELAQRKLHDFPENWELLYDAACYASLLGKREEAESLLLRAMCLGDGSKVAALASRDPDLVGLRRPLKPKRRTTVQLLHPK